MEHYDVVVIGAGLAGLAAGATAARAGASTLILDRSQPGGRASTDERGRYRFNRGSHALFAGGEAEAVLRRLGVSVPQVPAPVERARGRVGDRVSILPAGPRRLLTTNLLGTRGKLGLGRILGGVKRWRPAEMASLTIGEWLDRFHLSDDARALMLMFVRLTTYIHDEDHASADVAVYQLQSAVTTGVRYVNGGFGSVVDGLATAAQRNGVDLQTESDVSSVIPTDAGVTVVASGRDISAGAVVLAAGTPDAAAVLLERRPAAWAGLGPKVEASCLDVGLRAGSLDPLYGIDRPIYLSDHALVAEGLAPAGGGLVHVLRYLALGEETPADTLRESMEEHAQVAGVDPAAIEEHRFLRRMTVVGAMPTPATGGLAGRPDIASTGVPGVYVAGDWVGPRGWLSHCALSSGEAAGAAAAQSAGDRAGTHTGAARADRRSSVRALRPNGLDQADRLSAPNDVP
jgi:phytoene dehydrogenase-like protein